VRRWRIWDSEVRNQPSIKNTAKSKKYLQFLKAIDGKDWVWVMGEHEDDITIEEIIALEARKEAKKQAEIETSEFRKSVQAELTEMLEFDSIKSVDTDEMTSHTPTIEEIDIYCSVDDLKDRISKSKKTFPSYSNIQMQPSHKDSVSCFNFAKSNERNTTHQVNMTIETN
jgi:hypothetical protein